MSGFEGQHGNSYNKPMTSPYFFQKYGKVEINLQTTCCHYICTLGKANTPLVSPCKRREGAPSHAPLRWQPFRWQQVTSLGNGPVPGTVTLPMQTPARPLNRCLPHRNPGDYNTSASHWLLARQAKQLNCYGNFMVLIKFISSLLIKFCH